MTSDTLLRQLESLSHDRRMRQIVEIGRNSTSSPTIAATLDILEQGSIYDRFLALFSCYGSYDGGRVLRSLTDPSRYIRSLGISLLPYIGDDNQVLEALATLPKKQCRGLIRKLYQHRRQTVIDAFLDRIAAQKDPHLSTLLPFGSPKVVSQYLEQALIQTGQSDWQRLARLHPHIIVKHIQTQAEAAMDFDRRLIWQVNATLPDIAEFCPEKAIALVGILARQIPLAQLNLQRLVELRPNEMADLILNSSDRVNISFNYVAHKLTRERLLALIEHHPNNIDAFNIWLEKLTPGQREDIYTECSRYWRNADGCINSSLVELLPRHLRETEGRYHLANKALATRPSDRLPYAAFLPWDEARTILEPFIRNPDAQLRAVALAVMVTATKFQRHRLPDLMAMVRARSNEQDPVRGAMLMALVKLPPSMWRQEHLNDLSEIIRDTLNAADLSQATASSAEHLIIALVPFHPAWAAEWWAFLVRTRGRVSFVNLSDRLSDVDVLRIAPILLPVLQSWKTRESEGQIIQAARSLGKRLRVFDGLVDILEQIIYDTSDCWTALGALDVIAEHRRDRIASLIPELIKKDPSWATLGVVYRYLHRCRQDLITPFLGQQSYTGRFSTGKTRFVLPIFTGFYRWTETQQKIFAQTLNQLTSDGDRDTPAILTAITQLAALPAVLPTRLMELASNLNSNIAVRDAALRALGKLDAGQGVPTLLEAMGDDRARIAIYALRRSILNMPVTQALPLLQAVPLEKVTVAKEVVRLVGELQSEEAYQYLLELNNRNLHRDVRVALLRGLWDYLERSSTWVILESAAESPDAALATSIGHIPAERLSPTAQKRLVRLLAKLLAHPTPEVRVDMLKGFIYVPVSDSDRVLLPRLLELMNSSLPDESRAAASAVFAIYSEKDAQLVGEAVKSLIANRRALLTSIQALHAAIIRSRRQLLPTARAVIEALAIDRLTVNLRVQIAIIALPWDEVARFFVELTASGEMHAEALMTAVVAMKSANHRRTDAQDLAQLEATLATTSDERLRRLALAALVTQSQRGWDDKLLARLNSYRRDSSPLVAAAAQFTFPPAEVDP